MPDATPAPPAAEPKGVAGRAVFPTPRQLLLVLLGYFALQVIIRCLLSGTSDLDESEQCVLTQRLSWGYGPQPPLYTWLQSAFFAVFGQSIFALSLLKNLLLASTYLLTYYNGRFITGRAAVGLAAAVSLLFLPEVAWESQRDLSHSVLASTLAAATLACLLRAQGGRVGWYGLLGLCFGLGLLSKYNYGFWPLGLLLAALSVREFRAVVLNWRMLLALGIGAALVLPNLLWVRGHQELAFAATSNFHMEASGGKLQVFGAGLWQIVFAIGSFLGPVVLVWLAVMCRAPRLADAPRPDPACVKLLWRALVVIVVLLILVMGVFAATRLRQRWFQPVLICTPVLLAAWAAPRLDLRRLRWLTTLGLLVMLVVLVVIPGRIVFAEAMKREEPLTHPYAALAAQIRPVLPASTLLVAESRLLAGNLHRRLPGTTAIVRELAELFPARTEHCFLVWNATRNPLPPKPLLDWAQSQATADLRQVTPQYFSASYQYHSRRQYRLGLLQVR